MSFSYYLKIKRHLTVRKDFPPEIICSRILLHWCRLEKCYTNDVDSTEKHFRWGCSPAETPPLHRQFWGGSWMVGPGPGQWGHCAENTSVHRSRVASAPAPGLTGSLSRVFSTHRPGRSRENGLRGCTARGSLSCCSEGLGPGGQGRPGRPPAPAPQPLPHCLRPDANPVTRCTLVGAQTWAGSALPGWWWEASPGAAAGRAGPSVASGQLVSEAKGKVYSRSVTCHLAVKKVISGDDRRLELSLLSSSHKSTRCFLHLE